MSSFVIIPSAEHGIWKLDSDLNEVINHLHQ